MMRQAFKLIWNRRRANALLLIELLVSFLVLCVVLTQACRYLDNWRQPLGFDYENVWRLDLVHEDFWMMAEEERVGMYDIARRLRITLEDMEEIEAVSPMSINLPFSRGSMGQSTHIRGREVMLQQTPVAPVLARLLDFELVDGRWLEPGDEQLDRIPMVLTRSLAADMFGDEDPIGKEPILIEADGTPEERDEDDPVYQVVGVIADYRRYGELEAAPYSAFLPFDSEDLVSPLRNMVLRVRGGTTAAFEEKLIATAHGVAPDWTFTVSSLAEEREARIRDTLLPLLIGATVAGFLIVMVGMGLVGVLWQNVTRRTREIGLRRAVGATADRVQLQVLFELAALTTIAVGIGTLLYIQVPILELQSNIPRHVYVFALGLAMLVIYTFVAICGLYPSWLATRVDPVRALQYE